MGRPINFKVQGYELYSRKPVFTAKFRNEDALKNGTKDIDRLSSGYYEVYAYKGKEAFGLGAQSPRRMSAYIGTIAAGGDVAAELKEILEHFHDFYGEDAA